MGMEGRGRKGEERIEEVRIGRELGRRRGREREWVEEGKGVSLP